MLASGVLAPERIDSGAEKKFDITVLFTSTRSTIAAMKRAGELASHLSAKITLVVPQIVPYPLPLASPPVLLEFNERRFRVVAEQSPVETNVRLYLCRDCWQTLETVLAPHSVVVVGTRKRWWPNADKALARKLKRAGHDVILAETE